jgi:hypothetical protein
MIKIMQQVLYAATARQDRSRGANLASAEQAALLNRVLGMNALDRCPCGHFGGLGLHLPDQRPVHVHVGAFQVRHLVGTAKPERNLIPDALAQAQRKLIPTDTAPIFVERQGQERVRR